MDRFKGNILNWKRTQLPSTIDTELLALITQEREEEKIFNGEDWAHTSGTNRMEAPSTVDKWSTLILNKSSSSYPDTLSIMEIFKY